MDHADHVALIRDGVGERGGVWLDLGSGRGAFTLALADLIGPSGVIYSLDRDAAALAEQRRVMTSRFPAIHVEYRQADFTQPLALPPVDGVVMANALHFVRDQAPVLRLVHGYLRPGGRLILVEYNTDRGNHWVPYPVSYETWRLVAQQTGFTGTRLLHRRPSRFLGEIYAALSIRPRLAD